jgi:hypothetical protein
MAGRVGQTASCSACQRVPSYAQVRPIPRGGTNKTGQRPVPRPKSGGRGPVIPARVLDRVHHPAPLPSHGRFLGGWRIPQASSFVGAAHLLVPAGMTALLCRAMGGLPLALPLPAASDSPSEQRRVQRLPLWLAGSIHTPQEPIAYLSDVLAALSIPFRLK